VKRRRQTAYHEAAHAVLAYHSRFFRQSGRIRLGPKGGEIRISVDRRKFDAFQTARSESEDPLPAIAEDRAVILCGGVVGAEIARRAELIPSHDTKGAVRDHAIAVQELEAAGLPVDLVPYYVRARKLLEREWWAIEKVAAFLSTTDDAEAEVVREMIENWEGESA